MKEIKIISKKIVEIEDKETIITCDICGSRTYHERHCKVCQRDICDVHSRFEGEGDYPSRFCIECWKIGEPFRIKEGEIQIKYEELLEANREEWYKKAKEILEQK